VQNLKSALQSFAGLPLIRLFTGRGRLVRDYFFISVLLIGGGLITSGLVEIYFRYLESRDQLALVQKEVASGAAFKIDRFVQEIHNTLRGATKSREIAPKGLTTEFRFELEKLLLIAPAVTEALALDMSGAIRVQASRLRTVLPDAKRDLSALPGFQQAKQGKSYFGPVHFVRGSEPYMTIAVPIERFAGDVIGVLQAEVTPFSSLTRTIQKHWAPDASSLPAYTTCADRSDATIPESHRSPLPCSSKAFVLAASTW